MRPHEFSGATHPALFIDDEHDESGLGGAEANDIIQSPYLGDCYFLSALSIMCGCRDAGDLVPQLIVEEKYFHEGLIGVKFFKEGKWWHVAIDTLIATSDGKQPIFARNKDINEWWMSLIEKAYAKMHGCYEVLDAGYMNTCLTDLTGAAPGEIDVKNLFAACKKKDGTYDHAKALTALAKRSKGILLQGASCDDGGSEEAIGDGLHSGHAYSINQVKQLSNGVTLVQMRNPWGGHEWSGAWSDKDTESWTPQFKREVGFTDAEDGMFWMSVADFAKKFTKITFADLPTKNTPIYRCESAWTRTTAGGQGKNFKHNPQLLMQVNQKQDITICLSQPDNRMKFSKIHEKNPWGRDEFWHVFENGLYDEAICCMVFKGSLRKEKRTGIIKQSECAPSRTVTVTLKDCEPGDYIIVPLTYDEGVCMNFRLRIFCEYPVNLVDTKGGKDFQIFEANDNAITAGLQDTPLDQPGVKIPTERLSGNEIEAPVVKHDPRHLMEAGMLGDLKEDALMASWKIGDVAPSKWKKGEHWSMSEESRFKKGEMCCVIRADGLRFAKVERDVGDGTYDLITSMTEYGLARKHFVPARFICKLPHDGDRPKALLRQIGEIFDIIDSDGSGCLDFEFHADTGFGGEMAGHEGKRILMDCGVDVEDIDKLAHELSELDMDGNGQVDRNEVLSMRGEKSPSLMCPSLAVMLLRIHCDAINLH